MRSHGGNRLATHTKHVIHGRGFMLRVRGQPILSMRSHAETGITTVREIPKSGQASHFRDTVEIPRILPLVHPLFKWNYVARPFCIVDKIGESEIDVVRVRAKSTNCRSRECMYNYIY